MSIKREEENQPISTINDLTQINMGSLPTSVLTIQMPKIAGYWIPVEGTRISTPKMPSKFHRWTMKVWFGFRFEEITK